MFELTPYRSFAPVGSLRREMNDLLGRFWNPQEQALGEGAGSYVPNINFKETDENFELTAEVPGMDPEDIEVNLTGDLLTIKGEKKEEKEEADGDYHLVERRFGSFLRSFRLPSFVKSDKLKALHKDGVLTVTLPKSAESATTKVKIDKG